MQLSELAVGIISSILATILTSLAWFMWTRFRKRDPLWSLLGVNPRADSWLCYGNVNKKQILGEKPAEKPEREYATFEYGDIAAVLLVFDRLKEGKGKVRHLFGNDLDVLEPGNVISVGGPKWNRVTEKLIGRMGSPLYFELGTSGIIEKRRAHQSCNVHAGKTAMESDGSIRIIEFGFIISGRKGIIDKRFDTAVVAAGYTTYGVMIAIEYLMQLSRSDIKVLKKRLRGDKRFALLVKGTIEGDDEGKFAIANSPELVAWIPENDFREPYSYSYRVPVTSGQ